jgi:S1-C subfamily serine protease
MLGITNKTLHEKEAGVLQRSGKVRVRGPLTEEQMRTCYASGTLSPKSIIRKSDEDRWQPLQSHDDLFPKSLLGPTAANHVGYVFRSAIRKAAGIFRRSPDVVYPVIRKSVSLVQRRPKTVAAVVLPICGLLVAHHLYYKRLNPKHNPAAYVKNVATVYGGHGRNGGELGKGFFIKPDGLVVTCLHIITQKHAVEVEDGEGRHHAVERVAFIDDKNDLAVLKVSSAVPCPPGLKLGESGTVEKGEHAFALGRGASVDEEVVDTVLNTDPLTLKEVKLFMVAASPPNWSDGAPVLDKKGRVIGVTTTGPAGRDYSLFSAATRAASRGKNNWRYQGKTVIPVSSLSEAASLNGLEYYMLPRNENWKLFRESQTGYGTAIVFGDPRNIEKLSYEPNSIADRGNGLKRIWVKRYSDVVMQSFVRNPEMQKMFGAPKDNSSSTLVLYDVDCTTHQRRSNIRFNTTHSLDRIEYNFDNGNKWTALEPELDKEICPVQ